MINKQKTIALSEITILVIAIFSFSYLIGAEVGFVGGQETAIHPAVEANTGPATAEIPTSAGGSLISTTNLESGAIEFNTGVTGFQLQSGTYIDGSFSFAGREFIATQGNPLTIAVGENTWTVTQAGETSAFNLAPKLSSQITAQSQTAVQGTKTGLLGQIIGYHGGGFLDGIISGAAWAGAAYLIVRLGGELLGVDENKVDAASIALAGGVFAGRSAFLLTEHGSGWLNAIATKFGWSAGAVGFGVGAVVTIALYLLLYKDEKYKIVTFECQPWDAPVGGEDCEKCNQQGFPCSEYQCKSLGQACEIVNKGTEEEKCEWINRQDVEFPQIKPWLDVLTADHEYRPFTDNTVSPPERGVEIINLNSAAGDGCVQAFTPLQFGINLDEPGKCKLDYVRRRNFDEMSFFFGGSSLFRYNHSQILSLPGPNATNNENPVLENDGVYELYTRCQDANGNYNTANFLIKFCVEKGPDQTPPLIVSTSLLNGMPVAHNITEIDIDVYTNEPADCKWSRQDKDYDEMENAMQCSRSVFDMNAQLLYKCTGNLDGIKSQSENDYFFRCKDQPLANENDRNENRESFGFKILGTQPLFISSAKPNGTIKDSTSPIKVTLEARTREGFDEGRASCYFSDTGEKGSFILFDNTDSHESTQDLFLAEGSYEYEIRCIDLGGNSDQRTVSFEVDSDTSAPLVVRVYKFDNQLRVITSEEADECVYGINSCQYSFNDGQKMTQEDETIFVTEWSTDFTYFIKCKDEFNNQPLPNQCSLIVRPFEFFEFELEEE